MRRFAAALLALALLPLSAGAQERALPQSRAEIQLSFAPVVRQVSPAVVNIYSRRVEQVRSVPPLFEDPLFRRFFGDQLMFGQPRERVQQSLGSGVVVDAEGVIVTNNHVIEGATEIVVALADRREFEAKLLAADPKTDIAVLRIDTKGEQLPVLAFRDSDDIEIGDLVLAVGNPFGVGQTVTQGIVSALARTGVGDGDTQSFIQTDAAINPGQYGGALVTMDGRLVGINTAIYSRSGGSMGIGFAIPSNLVNQTVHQAVTGKGIVRPWLGAGGQMVTAELAGSLGMARPAGVLLSDVYAGGPADRAGLKTGDIILKVDGREVLDPRALKFRIAARGVGETATLDIQRKGEARKISLPLETPPENPPRDVTTLAGNGPLSGAIVGNMSPAYNEELGLDSFGRGVVVTDATPNGLVRQTHLRRGDILVEVNGVKIATVSDLKAVVQKGARDWRITIRRGDQTMNLKYKV